MAKIKTSKTTVTGGGTKSPSGDSVPCNMCKGTGRIKKTKKK